MVLELSVVLGPAGARTKWRHGLVMQSQKATEGGMGSAHFFHAQGCMWAQRRLGLKSLVQRMASIWTGWFPGQVPDWLTVV